MNEYVKKLEEIEKQKQALESQNPTLETQRQIYKLNSDACAICEKYLQELEECRKSSIAILKKQDDDLRKQLFNLRLREAQLIRNPDSEEYIQNSKQIKVVHRELARIRFEIQERGK